MKSNLAQHPCRSKCSVFKAEQDFLVGDSVVYADHIELDHLTEIEAYQADGYWWLTDGNIASISQIRTASVAELQEKRRLMEASL